MTPRQLALIAIAFGALLLLWGAAALIRGGESRAAAALPAIARDSVDTVAILRAGDTSLLARRDTGDWTVNGYPAERSAVGRLLEALADTLRVAEPVAERTASHPGLGVDSAGGTRVRVAGGGGAIAELVVGHRSPDLDGGYLRRAGDSTVYLVRGPLAELLGQGPNEWRDRRMGGVTPDSVAGIEVTRAGTSYALRRGDSGWRFLGSRPATDSAAVARLLEAYRRLEGAGLASAAQADSARFDPADRRVRLLQGDGSPLLTLALDSAAGGLLARVDSDSVVYRMDSWTADRLAPPDSTLRARPASP